MNPDNHPTLEACKRLAEAGIVMETDFYHYIPYPYELPDTGEIVDKKFKERLRGATSVLFYPAPTMAKLLRELIENDLFDDAMLYHCPSLQFMKDGQIVSYKDILSDLASLTADALIDLRIWLEGRKG